MRCFSVYSDEIAGRLDPLYYYSDAFQVLKKSGFTIKTIGDVISYIKTGFPAGSNSQLRNKQGIIQIRPTNINKDNLLVFEKNIYIKPDIAEKRKEDVIKKREILFNNTNSQELVGKTAYFDLEGNYFCSNHITRIKVKEDIILPKYLWILLNLYQRNKVFFNLCTNWNNQSGVNIESSKRIKIPIPSIKEQEKIIVIYEEGLNAKKSKESEAQQLLDSIGDYVLDELGIKLPELEKKMCFTVSFEEIETGRIDPNNFLHPQDTPSSKKFKEKTLNEVAELVKGQSVTKEKITEGDYLVVAGGQTSPYSINVYNHKGNVITVSASGAYSGYVWYHQNPIFASDCTVIKSVNEKEISTFYLYCVMKAKQRFIYNMQQGAGQPHVYSRDLSKLKIPLSPLEIQNKIAEEVKRRMQRAEQLQKDAKEVLEKAKLEVEKIILGS